MGSPGKVRQPAYGQRMQLSKEELDIFFGSLQNAFGPGGLGKKASQQMLQRELELMTQFGSQFAEREQGLRQQMIQRDPILNALQGVGLSGLGAIAGGLSGLNEPGALPEDLRRSFTEEIRSAQAARGVLESPRAALGEAVRLAGGTEAFRAQRIAQAAPFISSSLGLGSPLTQRSFNPLTLSGTTGGQFFQGQQAGNALDLQRRLAGYQAGLQSQQGMGQAGGALLGLGLSFIPGIGPYAGMAAAGLASGGFGGNY